jgi:tetratricopeptide (TPR) repeat protein
MSQSSQITGKPNDKIDRAELDKMAKALTDFRKKIYFNINHTPEDSSGDYIRGLLSRLLEEYNDAIKFYSKAIELDPDNPGLYSSRAEAYWQMEDYERSLQDYEKALERDNLDVNKFFEGPFDEISRKILPAIKGYDRSIAFPEKELESFLEASCKAIITRFPKIPAGYLHLGIYHLAKDNYDDAILNLTKYIKLTTENYFGFFLRGICNSRLRRKDEADDDFSNATESKPGFASGQVCEDRFQFGKDDDNRVMKNLDLIKKRLKNYILLNNTTDYSKFLGFVGQKYSIYIMLKSLDIFFKPHHNKIIEDSITLAKYLDRARFEQINVSNELNKLTSEIFSYYPNFTSLSDVMERDSEPVFRISAKLSLLKYLASGFIPMDIDWTYEDSVEDKEKGLLGLIDQKKVNQQYNFTYTLIHLTEALQKELTEIIKRKEQEKAQALVDERNKIIADLSHSIKNLISTVIDPLENLKQEKIVKPAVIRNALRGANLVREIVNAMNLSFKGSIEDFYYDARINTDKGKMDLESIINASLIYSIGNMFDGKYFSNFVQKYFPTKSVFEEAKPQWTLISQSSDVQEIMGFLQKYFFEIDLAIVDGSKYVMGNEKGSAMKLLILFQELILNAVKYSAFVSKEQRFLHIKFDPDPRQMSVRIENRYKEKAKAKTSGIGHIIVENFAKLLNTKPVTKKDSDIYSVEIKFVNFWGK